MEVCKYPPPKVWQDYPEYEDGEEESDSESDSESDNELAEVVNVLTEKFENVVDINESVEELASEKLVVADLETGIIL